MRIDLILNFSRGILLLLMTIFLFHYALNLYCRKNRQI